MTNRPIASLSPTLLARKGAARPAMRPQIQPLRAFQESTARQLDDLGWNDMGGDGSETYPAEPEIQAAVEAIDAPQTAEIVPLVPVAEPIGLPVEVAVPEVVRQQEDLTHRVAAERTVEAERIVEAPRPRRSALSDGRRAAFTLRLDAERHLKLRLASVTSNRSAQQLVTEALDRLIAELPDVAELAAKVREPKR